MILFAELNVVLLSRIQFAPDNHVPLFVSPAHDWHGRGDRVLGRNVSAYDAILSTKKLHDFGQGFSP